ncbi:hypothetical protein [uncultured Roseobacter sp.]|uniref:hypothetical protein n=1 Tax=uncultured Roseobacter sp. TaxID=114847 RepID=UPI00261BDECE|nr:hypothetical protein [uncultured Roseobacter sp.]
MAAKETPAKRAENERKFAKQIAHGQMLAEMYGWSYAAVYEMAINGEFDEDVRVQEERGPAPSYIA